MRTMTLSCGPVVLANLAILLEAASDVLHEIERDAVSDRIWDEITRAQAMITIAQNTCTDSVYGIEHGPDYALGGEA